ncbi:unnamed protein product [Boreogadus saida]
MESSHRFLPKATSDVRDWSCADVKGAIRIFQLTTLSCRDLPQQGPEVHSIPPHRRMSNRSACGGCTEADVCHVLRQKVRKLLFCCLKVPEEMLFVTLSWCRECGWRSVEVYPMGQLFTDGRRAAGGRRCCFSHCLGMKSLRHNVVSSSYSISDHPPPPPSPAGSLTGPPSWRSLEGSRPSLRPDAGGAGPTIPAPFLPVRENENKKNIVPQCLGQMEEEKAAQTWKFG